MLHMYCQVFLYIANISLEQTYCVLTTPGAVYTVWVLNDIVVATASLTPFLRFTYL